MYWGSVCDVSALCEVWRDRAVGGMGWGRGRVMGRGGGGDCKSDRAVGWRLTSPGSKVRSKGDALRV